ncbi:MAG: bacteriocin [Parachlamydiaceae bacterium]|nr:bacteriocin [Parachlamydiaceae bacterium]
METKELNKEELKSVVGGRLLIDRPIDVPGSEAQTGGLVSTLNAIVPDQAPIHFY